MTDIDQEGPDEGLTSPEEDTKDATTPPGNPERDEEATQDGEDKLEQAGGGH